MASVHSEDGQPDIVLRGGAQPTALVQESPEPAAGPPAAPPDTEPRKPCV